MKHRIVLLVLFLLIFAPAYAQTSAVPISPENAASLSPLLTIGRGALLDLLVVDDGARVIALSTGGITLYDADLNEQGFIAFAANYMGSLRYATFVGSGRLTGYTDGVVTAVLPSRQPGAQDAASSSIEVDLASGAQRVVAIPDMGAGGTVSADGRWVVGASAPIGNAVFLQVTDTTSSTTRDLIPAQGGRLLALRLVPGDTLVTVAALVDTGTTSIQVWNLLTGDLLAETPLVDRVPQAVITDTAVFIGSREDAALVIYSLPDLTESSRIPNAVLVGADAEALVYLQEGDESTYYVFDLLTNTVRNRFTATSCYGVGLTAAFGAERLYLYYRTSESFIAAYDLNSGERRALAGAFGTYIGDLTLYGDDLLAVAGGASRPEACSAEHPGNGVTFYALASGQPVRFLPSTAGVATHVAVHPESNLVALARIRGVDVYKDDVLFAALNNDAFDFFAAGLSLSSDGDMLALATAGQAYLWATDALHGEPRLVINGVVRLFRVSSVQFWGQTLVYVAEPGTDVVLADAATGETIASLPHERSIYAFALAGDTLAVMAGNPIAGEEVSIHLYRLSADGAKQTSSFALPVMNAFVSLALSPDASLIVLSVPGGGDAAAPPAVILDAQSGALLSELPRAVQPLVFSPDGSLLIGADGVVATVFGAVR